METGVCKRAKFRPERPIIVIRIGYDTFGSMRVAPLAGFHEGRNAADDVVAGQQRRMYQFWVRKKG